MSIPSSTASSTLPTFQSAAQRAYQQNINNTRDGLTSLPSELFIPIVNQYLPQSETAKIPRLNCAAYLQMDNAKYKRTQLAFSGYELQKISENFAAAVKQCPRFKDLSIEIMDKSDLSNTLKLVADAVYNRAMVSLTISADPSSRRGSWETSAALELIKNLDFEKLKHLCFIIGDDDYVVNSPDLLLALLCKLNDCQELEVLQVSMSFPNKGDAEYHKNIQTLITALPQTVQNLGPYLVNNTTADTIMQCRNREAIQSCDLAFNANGGVDGITPEKLKAFLEFLPLEQMTEIHLSGEGLTGEMLDYIVKPLQQNTTLKSLKFNNSTQSRWGYGPNDEVLKLVQAISSKELRRFEMAYHLASSATQLVLDQKYREWEKLEVCSIGGWAFRRKRNG